jgi:hypothetical protein
VNHFFIGCYLLVVLFFKLEYIVSEVCVFIARHNIPGTGVVAVYASTYVLDKELHWILTRIFLCVRYCQLLKELQVLQEILVIIDRWFAVSWNFFIGSKVAACAGFVCIPANAVPCQLLEVSVR